MSLKILDIIKYEGPNNILIWKHPAEDFNTSSTLIVHESQKAVFFQNGQIADVFEAGKYKLHTGNIPILRKLLSLPTGGETPFHCEVYFVNMVEVMALKWGTDSKVKFLDPGTNIPFEIGASGEMSLRILEPEKLLVNLVGTETSLTPENLTRYFRGLMMSKIKSYLGRTIKEEQLSIFEIDSHLDVLSENMEEKLKPGFADYGIELVHFYVMNLVCPEDDPTFLQLRSLYGHRVTDVLAAQTKQQVELIHTQTRTQQRVMEAQAMAQKRQLEGYTYQEERAFDVAQGLADNEGVGQFTQTGVGLGMMMGVGSSMGSLAAGAVNRTLSQGLNPGGVPGGADQTVRTAVPVKKAGRTCISCGAQISDTAKFCPECGTMQEIKCPKCQTVYQSPVKFCQECGYKF